MKRSAQAVWEGGTRGAGTLSTDSKALNETQYSFSSRFQNGVGTNPEELVGAAHAGCFSMALAIALEQAGFPPERVETRALVSLEKTGEGDWEVDGIDLQVDARVPGIDAATFQGLAEGAKANCPISKLLKGARITMDARLVGEAAA